MDDPGTASTAQGGKRGGRLTVDGPNSTQDTLCGQQPPPFVMPSTRTSCIWHQECRRMLTCNRSVEGQGYVMKAGMDDCELHSHRFRRTDGPHPRNTNARVTAPPALRAYVAVRKGRPNNEKKDSRPESATERPRGAVRSGMGVTAAHPCLRLSGARTTRSALEKGPFQFANPFVRPVMP